MLISDNAIRQSWVALLCDKSALEAVSKFKQLAKQIELESGAKIIFVRSDNGTGEFGTMYQEALLQEGIQFEPSPPYKHSLNGVIERAMGKINAVIRSLLYQAKLHHLMWDYAVKHAVWLKNRLLTSALPYGTYFDAVTPFQAYRRHKPDL